MKKRLLFISLLFSLCMNFGLKAQTILAGESLVYGPMFSAVYENKVRVWVVTKDASPGDGVLSLSVTASSTPLVQLTGTIFNSDDRLGHHLRSFEFTNLTKGETYNASLLVNGVASDRKSSIINEQKVIDNFSFLAGGCGRIYDTTRCIDIPESKFHFNGDPEIFNHMALEKSDLMVWLGDQTYLLGLQHAAGQCPDGKDDWLNEDMAFDRYKFYRKYHDKLTMAMPQLAIVDNHDLGPNEFDKTMPTLAKTKKVYMDWWQNPQYLSTPEGQGLHSSYVYKDVEFFLTDNRSYRTGTAAHFGPDQYLWLTNALKNSTATFKVIINGTPTFAANQNSTGRNFCASQQGKDLVKFIQDNNINGVLSYSADLHTLGFWSREGDVKYPLYDLIDGQINSDTSANGSVTLDNTAPVMLLSGGRHAYVKTSVTGSAGDRRIKFEYVGFDGNTFFEKTVHQDMLTSTNADALKLNLKFSGDLTDASAFTHNAAAQDHSFGADKDGNANQALVLSQNTSVNIPASQALAFDKAYSLSFWINPGTLSPNGSTILSSGAGTSGVAFGISGNGKLTYKNLATGNTLTSDYNVLTNRWTYVVWKYDNVRKKLSLYYDGTLIQNWTEVATPVSSDTNVKIGGNFAGSIDELNLYGRLIADTDISKGAAIVNTRGKTLKFSGGTQKTNIPATTINPLLANNFTIEYWARVTSAPATSAKLLSNNARATGNLGVGLNFEFDSAQRLNLVIGNNTTAGWDKIEGKGPVWKTNEWHHVAITASVGTGASVKYYIDGVLLSSMPFKGYFPGVGLGLGYSLYYSGGTTSAEMDDLRIWTNTLTQADIVKHMNYSLEGNETNLALYYNFTPVNGDTTVAHGVGTATYDMNITTAQLTDTTAPIADIPALYRDGVSGSWSASTGVSNYGLTLPETIAAYESNVVVGKQNNAGISEIPNSSDIKYLHGGWNINSLNRPFAKVQINLAAALGDQASTVADSAQIFYLLQQDGSSNFSVVKAGTFDGTTITFDGAALVGSVYYLGWNTTAGNLTLSYNSPNVFAKNTAITNLNPIITGKATFSITPNLPAGLSINTATGVISGTPTEVTAMATYTVTATNSVASTSYDIVIAVNPGSAVCTPLTGTAFGTGPAYSVGAEFDKAFDGNISTYNDDVTSGGGYTGLDLGTAQVVTDLKYYPRSAQMARMTGGKFQGSNTSTSAGFVDLYTITSTPTLAWQSVSFSNTTAYRYYRYLSPASGYTNVAEIQFCRSSNFPAVSITSPANNATFPVAPVSVTINATATSDNATVSKVEFYNGATLLGTSTTSPYTYDWTNVAEGTYSLTAKAYDDLDAASTSSVVTIMVGNQKPTVSITSPANNATFGPSSNITINANATDIDGTVSKVEFYNGTTLLGTSTTSPYSFVWNGVPVGTYQLTAKAYDNATGMTTSETVNITVAVMEVINYPVVKGEEWYYLDNGSDLGSTWSAANYNVLPWNRGRAPFGYGDPVKTTISYGPSSTTKYITSYFAKDINVKLSDLTDNVEFGLRVDDGAVVYVNGLEVFRNNMNTGAVTYNTFAKTDIVDGIKENIYYTVAVPKSYFVEGKNRIAVEMHQASASSTDLRFDMYIKNTADLGIQCDGQHIGCFTSIAPTSQTNKLIMSNAHNFQVIMKQGDPFMTGGGNVPANNDYTAFVPTEGSSELGHLSVNQENDPGGVSMFDIHLNKSTKLWEVDNSRAVVFNNSALVKTIRNCSGGTTPWATVVTAEESTAAGDVNGDGYQDVGWLVEIDPVTAKVMDYGKGQEKLWAMGRMNHENVVVSNDRTTAYYGEDGGTHCLYKYIMDTPGNLSEGSVYVLKMDLPLSGSDPSSANGTWIKVPNATQSDRNYLNTVASSLGGTSFNGIEDVEINPITGQIYFTAKGFSRVYKFTDKGDSVTEFETFVGGMDYTVTTETGPRTEPWADGNDNLTFDDKGNLWVLQDGGKNYIWIVRPDHTQSNPNVQLFASMPSGGEPTGLTFTPDYKYGFFSIQHPAGSNVAQVDAAGKNIAINTSTTVVFSLKEKFIPDGTLGISNVVVSNDFKLYPNPSNGEVTIDLGTTAQSLSIEVYDILGRRLMSLENIQTTDNKVQLDLRSLKEANQLVIISVNLNQTKQHFKVVIN